MLFQDHCQQRFGLTRLPSSSSNVQLQTMPFRFDNFATDAVPPIAAPLAAAHEEAARTEINLAIGEREASRTRHIAALSHATTIVASSTRFSIPALLRSI